MLAYPYPNPIVTLPQGDCPVVQRHSNRPGARVTSQALEMQARMSCVLTKFAVGEARSMLNVTRQFAIELPEGRCATRCHERRSNAVSEVSGNAIGSARYSLST